MTQVTPIRMTAIEVWPLTHVRSFFVSSLGHHLELPLGSHLELKRVIHAGDCLVHLLAGHHDQGRLLLPVVHDPVRNGLEVYLSSISSQRGLRHRRAPLLCREKGPRQWSYHARSRGRQGSFGIKRRWQWREKGAASHGTDLKPLHEKWRKTVLIIAEEMTIYQRNLQKLRLHIL